MEHPVGLLGLLLVRPRRVLRRRASTRRPCSPASYDVPFLWTLPVAALVAAVLGVALGAVVFRVRSVRGELFALLTLAVTFVLAHDRAQHADRRRPRRLPDRGARCRALGADARRAPSTCWRSRSRSSTLLAALARSGRRGSALGLFAIHDDEDAAEVMGVPTYRYKLVAFGISCALAGVAGGIHALFVSYVTVERDVHDHGAADGRADERARRHAALGGTGARRDGDHAAALRVHGRRPCGRRQGGDRRDPDRGDPVHARRHPRLRRSRSGLRFAPVRPPIDCRARAAAARHAAPRGRTAAPATVLLARRAACASRSRACRRSTASTSTCARGEILGLLGPNGSGQVDVHQRRQRPLPRRRRAAIVFDGRELARRPAHRIAARRHRAHVPDPAAVRAPDACSTTSRSPRCSAARRSTSAARAHEALHAGSQFTGLARTRRRAARRAQPAPAQVPRARARARVAAAPGAARRGAVGLTPSEIDERGRR